MPNHGWKYIATERARPREPDPKPAHRLWHSTPEGRANARRYYRQGFERQHADIPQWCQAEPQESLKPISRSRYEEDQAAAHVWSVSPNTQRFISVVSPRRGHKYFAFGDYDGPGVCWLGQKSKPAKQPTPAEQYWLDLDWRDPKNMQVYADPTDGDLTIERLHELRPLTCEEKLAGFSTMTRLADDRMVSLSDYLAICDADTPTARAYQAALEVLRAYYLDKRLRVEPAYLVAARIVVQCIEIVLLLRDYTQWARELKFTANSHVKLRALAKGAWLQMSPGTFYFVSQYLASMTLTDIGMQCRRHRSVIRDRIDGALFSIQQEYGHYCVGDTHTPPAKAVRTCYYVDEGIKNKRVVKPQVASVVRLTFPRADGNGSLAEALRACGDVTITRLPPGLAEDSYVPSRTKPDLTASEETRWQPGERSKWWLPTRIPLGERDYDSNPGVVIIRHYQRPADWRQIINALPNDDHRKSKLRDINANIARMLSGTHRSFAASYLRGDHHWTSEPVSPPSPCRSIGVGRDWKAKGLAKPLLRPIQISYDWKATVPLPINDTPTRGGVVGVRSPYFCGPIIQIGGKVYPRAATRNAHVTRIAVTAFDRNCMLVTMMVMRFPYCFSSIHLDRIFAQMLAAVQPPSTRRRNNDEPDYNELADELYDRGIQVFGPQDDGWKKRFRTWERYIRHLANKHGIPKVDGERELRAVDEQIEITQTREDAFCFAES